MKISDRIYDVVILIHSYTQEYIKSVLTNDRLSNFFSNHTFIHSYTHTLSENNVIPGLLSEGTSININ